jgi:uncharacterized protein
MRAKERLNSEEVIAQTRAWVDRAVIGLNLCPFARAVQARGQVHYAVSAARTLDGLLDDLIGELDALLAIDPAERDNTLLIHPHVLDDFLAFNDFLAVVDAVVTERGYEGILQVASFHPQYQFAGTEPDDLGNYTNRSPYPTLHLLREASIDRAIAAIPEAEAIFAQNVERLRALGLAGWNRLGIEKPQAKR